MHPHHRAQLATVIARFEADIRRRPAGPLPGARAPARARSNTCALGARVEEGDSQAGRPREPRTAGAYSASERRCTAARPPADAKGARAEAASGGRRARSRDAGDARGIGAPIAVGTRDGSAEVGAASPPEPGTSSPPVAASTSSTPTAESSGPAGQGETRAAPASGTGGGRRVRWTRETIVEELARWMVAGTALDPSFVQRHGPPRLVSAARRIFGRFDAALNVAGLHVAKLYPDGPPADGPRGGR